MERTLTYGLAWGIINKPFVWHAKLESVCLKAPPKAKKTTRQTEEQEFLPKHSEFPQLV
jgi:hypothetical protein